MCVVMDMRDMVLVKPKTNSLSRLVIDSKTADELSHMKLAQKSSPLRPVEATSYHITEFHRQEYVSLPTAQIKLNHPGFKKCNFK